MKSNAGGLALLLGMGCAAGGLDAPLSGAASAPRKGHPEASRPTGTKGPASSEEGAQVPPSLRPGSALNASSEPATPAPCPEDMLFVDAIHCPDGPQSRAHLRCLKKSRNEPNRLTICHRFAEGQRCTGEKRRQRYCIDRYEYPSRKGSHPPVMVSAYDAAALCQERGKRLCWESEWTAACEGRKLTPFPYGHERSAATCNIDNRWRQPRLSLVHHRDRKRQAPELERLDQSVPSGAMEGCQSDYGVFDLTGNLDEWVRTEWRRGKSGWAGLKGGAWGHVRNACRPITTSHVPQWSYYFVSFRCCRDPQAGSLQSAPEDGGSDNAAALWQPPAEPPPSHPGGRPLDRGWPAEPPP